MKKQVVIVGGGFAGLNAARILGNKVDIDTAREGYSKSAFYGR